MPNALAAFLSGYAIGAFIVIYIIIWRMSRD